MKNNNKLKTGEVTNKTWIIIGVLVIAAIVVTIITTNQGVLDQEFIVETDVTKNELDNDLIVDKEQKIEESESEDERIQSYYDKADKLSTWTSSDWEDYRVSMKESCESYNGEWLSDEWECVIDGNNYYYGIWEPAMECQNQGGSWLSEYNRCENSSMEWCLNFKGLITERTNNQVSFFSEENLVCRFVN